MFWCMHRTNVYLTEEQERALDARARVAGTSRSAVLREILDDELCLAAPSTEVEAGLADLALGYDQLVAGLFDEDPDLRIDQ